MGCAPAKQQSHDASKPKPKAPVFVMPPPISTPVPAPTVPAVETAVPVPVPVAEPQKKVAEPVAAPKVEPQPEVQERAVKKIEPATAIVPEPTTAAPEVKQQDSAELSPEEAAVPAAVPAPAPAPVPAAVPAPVVPARFPTEKFPYNTADPDLVPVIKEFLAKQEGQEQRVAALTGLGKYYYDFAQSLHDTWDGETMKLDGLTCARGHALLKATPIEVMAYMLAPKFVKEHNDMINDFATIDEYSGGMRLLLTHSKGMLLVSGREFLALQRVTLDPASGSIEFVAASVEDPRAPISSNYVRGEMKACFV